MAESDLEMIRASFDAWNRQDLDAVLADYTDDAVGVAPEGWPEQGELHGKQELRRQFETLMSSWREQSLEILEIRETDAGVLSLLRWSVTGRDSGFAGSFEIGEIMRLRDGKICRVEFYTDWAKARAAAGLEPEGAQTSTK